MLQNVYSSKQVPNKQDLNSSQKIDFQDKKEKISKTINKMK